jgi:hypothetical protein
MTAVLCASPFLADELARHTGVESTLVYRDDASPEEWLFACLGREDVSLVLYESRYFVDPAKFRSAHPETSFVLIASLGDDDYADEALRCGARAVLHKPLDLGELPGVLALVQA